MHVRAKKKKTNLGEHNILIFCEILKVEVAGTARPIVGKKKGREKNVEVVDLVKCFPMRTRSRRPASILRRTDRSKFKIEILTNLGERKEKVRQGDE